MKLYTLPKWAWILVMFLLFWALYLALFAYTRLYLMVWLALPLPLSGALLVAYASYSAMLLQSYQPRNNRA